MAEVLEQAVDMALKAKDPKQRIERREARVRRRDAELGSRNAAGGPCPDEADKPEAPCAAPELAANTPARSRHVPVAVRDRVLERAGHRCQFTGPDGTRCSARTGLEIEHTKLVGIIHECGSCPPVESVAKQLRTSLHSALRRRDSSGRSTGAERLR